MKAKQLPYIEQLLELGKQGKCAAYFEYEEMLLGMVDPSFDEIPLPPKRKL